MGWFKQYNNDPTRNVGALANLVREEGTLSQWGNNTFPKLGDMIFYSDYSHIGVVAEIEGDGSDPAQVFIIQASYNQGVINKMPLTAWRKEFSTVSFGHPSKD
jgi:hypothetical protein